MKKKAFDDTVKEIVLLVKTDIISAEEEFKILVNLLDLNLDSKHIISLYDNLKIPEYFKVHFSFAFILNSISRQSESEKIYEALLKNEPNNSAVLNNLSNIKKHQKRNYEAFELIEKANRLTGGKDETINWNYKSLLKIIEDENEIKSFYKNSEYFIWKETEWALGKLKNFIANFEKDNGLINNRILIPKRKFKVLMWTDEQKSLLLVDQWIERGYIRKIERGDFGAFIYEINPYLKKFIKDNKPLEINKDWLVWFDNINIESLKKINYFEWLLRIEKVNKKFKEMIKRDFDELIFNYLLWNKRSTIILSWSFIELLFTYYCEKNKFNYISYESNWKVKTIKLFDSTLLDFLKFFEEWNHLKQVIIHIGNISRIYRNVIHPWNELKNKEKIEISKVELCFNATIELMNYILK